MTPARTSRPARPAAQPAQQRSSALAQIHIAKAQLGLDSGCIKPPAEPGKAGLPSACTCAYHLMLWGVARVRSAKDLDYAGRTAVLEHLKKCGFRSTPPKKPTPGRPHNMNHPHRGDLLAKVEALLLEAQRPWAYADGMAKHMFGVDKLAFCHEGQLHKIVAALEIDKRRHPMRPD